MLRGTRFAVLLTTVSLLGGPLAGGCGGSAAPGSAASGTAAPGTASPRAAETGPSAAPTPSPASPAATPAASPEPSRADRLARMTVEEKVGQLFMPVLYGSRADTPHQENVARFGVRTPAEAIRRYHLGGVILFPWAGNVSSVSQVVALTNGLQRAAGDIPLLIGVDQENGRVSRLDPLVTKLPEAKVIGATGNTRWAREAARVTGTELRALGINLDFAPVADVNVNPRNPVIGPRAYGSDPKKVARMVGAAIDGFHAAGVAATAKHFPGHGDTTVDSHTGLPVIHHTKAQWEKLDAPPFRTAIAHGVDAIMSAHVVMPKLDRSGDPATLSKPILTGLLRKRLGFTGVVITDSLQMAGARQRYGDGEVAVRAILAGADILLMPPDFPRAYNAVLEAVRSGRISAKRLDESVARVLALKERRGLFTAKPADPDAAKRIVKSREHLRIAKSIPRS
ncbi:beta-N-acetylhexosaminidase [Thermopolyspora flexuosa]|uniref:beta-N-acetylhexosaminidase n=1 Tax=Thermopolyspora flexuosa TaxID=103836 RepID=A0A543J1X7_9ACTN|nr:beta-N-acetylhexosaminidase [Thermopolyspora flexuosa]TQM76811.1 beta-N-acetylhexosaminidase [Thermopolyspora flexuosa]